jgi:uncharacterized oligopeptide transporter (OPT) family protein
MSLVCVVMSFFIAIVASRATGETDTTPTGALGKITQLTFGVLAPGSVSTNLMSASMSAGVAIHAADLLTDLKSGYLLGARPRQQFFAQFFGVLAGGSVVVIAFQKLVPDYTVIGTERLPAPGAISWLAVAQGLTTGLSGLPRGATTLIAVGAAVGVVLVLADKFLPKVRRFIPSATGFGMAFTMPFFCRKAICIRRRTTSSGCADAWPAAPAIAPMHSWATTLICVKPVLAMTCFLSVSYTMNSKPT